MHFFTHINNSQQPHSPSEQHGSSITSSGGFLGLGSRRCFPIHMGFPRKIQLKRSVDSPVDVVPAFHSSLCPYLQNKPQTFKNHQIKSSLTGRRFKRIMWLSLLIIIRGKDRAGCHGSAAATFPVLTHTCASSATQLTADTRL